MSADLTRQDRRRDAANLRAQHADVALDWALAEISLGLTNVGDYACLAESREVGSAVMAGHVSASTWTLVRDVWRCVHAPPDADQAVLS